MSKPFRFPTSLFNSSTWLVSILLAGWTGLLSKDVSAQPSPPVIQVRVEWRDFAKLLQERREGEIAGVERDAAKVIAARAADRFGYFDWVARCPPALPEDKRTEDCPDDGHQAEWILEIQGRSDEFAKPPNGKGVYRRVILNHYLKRSGAEAVLLTDEYKPVADPLNSNNILYDTDSSYRGEKRATLLLEDLKTKLEEQLPALFQDEEVQTQLQAIPLARELAFEQNARIVLPVQRCRLRLDTNPVDPARFKAFMRRGGSNYDFVMRDNGATSNGEVEGLVVRDDWNIRDLLDPLPRDAGPFISWIDGLPSLFDEEGEDVDVLLELKNWKPSAGSGCKVVDRLEFPDEEPAS